jgi:diamine oxidase
MDFDSFLNGENLVNEDLVLWASVGVLHMPHSEDIPNTATPGNGGSIWLRPYNYFDQDPAVDLVREDIEEIIIII